jgi:hypothetical protein
LKSTLTIAFFPLKLSPESFSYFIVLQLTISLQSANLLLFWKFIK